MTNSTQIHIYALRDPRTNEVRYVGATAAPERRMEVHILQSKYETTMASKRWIRGIVDAGLLPQMEILEVVEKQKAPEVEKFWILKFHLRGCNLTNDKYMLRNSKQQVMLGIYSDTKEAFRDVKRYLGNIDNRDYSDDAALQRMIEIVENSHVENI